MRRLNNNFEPSGIWSERRVVVSPEYQLFTDSFYR